MKTYHPAGFCTIHGIFEIKSVIMGPDAQFSTLASITNCPYCGRTSEVLSGAYNVVNGRLNILLDPSVSEEALSALREVAVRLKQEEITRDEAVVAAAEISPKFASLFRGVNQGAVATVAAAIVTAISSIIVAKMNSSTTVIVNNYGAPQAHHETVSAAPKYPGLPQTGPLPEQKPKPLNRHQRRKLDQDRTR